MSLKVSGEEILQGNIAKGLIKVAIPLMLLNLVNTLYGIVDTIFVGRIGELQVGAVSLVAPVTGCGSAFIYGLSAAGIGMISQALGEGDRDRANRLATHLLVIAVALGAAVTLLCLGFTRRILGWLNTPEDIYQDTRGYYLGIAFDYVFLFILTTFQAIRQASGDSRAGVRLNIAASLLNVVLDPLFIFVFGLGTFGAAAATVLSKAVMCPVAIAELVKKGEGVSISLREHRIRPRLAMRVLGVSLPASLGQLLSSLGFVLMSREIVSYGSIVMSGYGIGNQVSSIFYIPINVIGLALPTFIGQNLGAGNRERTRRCYTEAMKLVVILSAVVIVIGLLTSRYIVRLFVVNASERLLQLSLEYANFAIVTAVFMGWFNSLCGVFFGSTHTKIAMVLSAARLLFVRMPIVYLLARFTDLQYTGIWISMVLSNLIICITGQIIYHRYPWDTMAWTEKPEQEN